MARNRNGQNTSAILRLNINDMFKVKMISGRTLKIDATHVSKNAFYTEFRKIDPENNVAWIATNRIREIYFI